MADKLSVSELKSLDSGRPFEALLLLRRVTTKTASNGNPFLSLEFGDRTGSFNATLFNDHPKFHDLQNNGEGAALKIEGRSDYYQGRFSPKMNEITILDEAELEASGDLSALVEVAPEDPQAM